MRLQINGRNHEIIAPWDSEKLLWVLREYLGLVGSKFGCGVGLCGACTVLVDGQPTRSCLIVCDTLAGRPVTTIEGMADAQDRLHALQRAWLEENVPQCGFCQAGQIMAAAALLRVTPRPTDAQIDVALNDNLCRCGTQTRVRKAVRRAAGKVQ